MVTTRFNSKRSSTFKKTLRALKPGDSVAMVCSMCKSVMVHNVTTERGHIKIMSVGEKHLCPGCGSTITVVGTGKGLNGAHDEVKHVCEKCGGRMYLSRREPHPEGGTKHELQTFRCASCEHCQKREVELNGVI